MLQYFPFWYDFLRMLIQSEHVEEMASAFLSDTYVKR